MIPAPEGIGLGKADLAEKLTVTYPYITNVS